MYATLLVPVVYSYGLDAAAVVAAAIIAHAVLTDDAHFEVLPHTGDTGPDATLIH